MSAELLKLQEKLKRANLPEDLREKALQALERAATAVKISGQTITLEQTSKFIEIIVSLPWNQETPDNLDLKHVREILDKNHFGLERIKERILEYLAVLKLQTGQVKANFRSPILCFVGLVGTGKTSIAASIAEAVGRRFERIPLGGLGSVADLRGESRANNDAEPGQIVKALMHARSRNPVLLLDEIDRAADVARADIMGVLVELLDPEQNHAFTDHFVDYPVDLSKVIFIATANNTKNIATAVLDRLEIIEMPSYSDDEKIKIAKEYIFPRMLTQIGLPPASLTIEEGLWPQIVRPLGFDPGIRSLERTIDGIGRKVAKKIVEGETRTIVLNAGNVKEFLPSY